MDDLTHTCYGCSYFDITDRASSSDLNSNGDIFCRKHGYVDPYNNCSSWTNAYRGKSQMEACRKAHCYKQSPGYWYIVSMICHILGLPKDCEYMKTFEFVLNNYIKETSDGEQLLKEYDLYGCMVANRIKLDFDMSGNPFVISKEEKAANKENVDNLINTFIIPQFDKITELVKKGSIKSALLRYVLLTRKLMEYYNISYQPLEVKENNFENKTIIADTLEKYRSIGAR